MKIIFFLLLFSILSISILNANSFPKELNVQLIANNYQENELQKEKIPKEYLFRPNSIWRTDLLGMIIGSDFYTYHNNHIGTPLFMTDLIGTKVWESKIDSFGEVSDSNGTPVRHPKPVELNIDITLSAGFGDGLMEVVTFGFWNGKVSSLSQKNMEK